MKNITIKEETHKKLKKIAEKESLTMSSFLDSAVSYFDKTKVSPQTDIVSIKEEMKKLEKRVNQVIAFIRKFENDNLIPLIKEIKKDRITATETYNTINNKLDKEEISKIFNEINNVDRNLSVIINEKEETIKQLEQVINTSQETIKRFDSNENARHLEILKVLLNKDEAKQIAEKYNIIPKKGMF